jgi:hypothetical protein
VVLDGPGQDGRDLVVVAGAYDGVGRVGQVAGAGAQQVGRRLAPGAQPACVVVGADVLGPERGAQGVEQGVVEARGGQRRVGDGGARVEPEGELDEPAGGLGERGSTGGVAPPLGVHLGLLGRFESGHVLQCDI